MQNDTAIAEPVWMGMDFWVEERPAKVEVLHHLAGPVRLTVRNANGLTEELARGKMTAAGILKIPLLSFDQRQTFGSIYRMLARMEIDPDFAASVRADTDKMLEDHEKLRAKARATRPTPRPRRVRCPQSM